jgi:penicillin-binding protein 1A
MYLNTVYFGQGAYGIQSAATTYFSRPASKLSLAQGALLAGLIAAPSSSDPVLHPDLATVRRNQVLTRMRSLGMIEQQQYLDAVKPDLHLDLSKRDRYPAAHFVDYVKQWFVTNPEFGPTQEARYDLLYKGGLRIYTTIDLALQKDAEDAVNAILAYGKDPSGAMTVIDPRNGAIRAMVGGRDYFSKSKIAKFNLAIDVGAGRQAGSSFKPFALVTALEQGMSPLEVFSAPSHIDIRLPPGYKPPIWPVDNYDGGGGGSMTLEQATINSVNTVYAQVIMRVGARNVVDTAHRMGITSPLHAYPSAVLGTNGVNTLEMASAFGTLATLGSHTPPMAVTRITDSGGNLVWAADPELEEVINPGIAWTVDQILQKVVQRGTGVAANIGRPVAGKTGTAQSWTNAWFVGFVPQLVGAVWVGFPQGQVPMVYPRVRIPHVLGGTWPAQIWRLFMLKATRHMRVENWQKPTIAYSQIAVDLQRGCLPNSWTLPTDIVYVTYFAGTQPTHICTEPAGPQQVAMPSVVGLKEDPAQSLLESYRFVVQTKTEESTAAPGTIIAQFPASGVLSLQGTAVTITVAKKPAPPSPTPSVSPSSVPVPDVTGLLLDEATKALTDAGFAVTMLSEWECDPPDSCGAKSNVVWKQSPPGGAVDDAGSTVTVWVNPTK